MTILLSNIDMPFKATLTTHTQRENQIVLLDIGTCVCKLGWADIRVIMAI